ncbi:MULTISPECIES: hypothetical protein [Streptomyces]|uniref:Secreted protein n=1 Tax=Streptomyces viridochromogenes TaxID=1938 RepID=A0A0L8K1I2_STRVR|nr:MULTISPECIES: hypothetical protein [Streptomyces]KOG19743.1 hypothetical protein ADK34_24490 [Streptomyces viridochromogenes]
MIFQQFLSRASSRFGWCATALGLAVSVAVPAQHAAADTTPARLQLVRVVKATKTVADFQQVQVECPDGTYAISGGTEAVAPSVGYDAVGLVGSFPYARYNGNKARGWIGNARNFGRNPTTVNVWAVCAIIPSGYELVKATLVQVPSDQTVTVSCPAGKTALGGGAEIQSAGSSLTKSYPSAFAASGPTTWTVAGPNRSNSDVGVLGFVTCADPIADNVWTTYKVSTNSPPAGSSPASTGGGSPAAAPPRTVRSRCSSRPGPV